MAGGALAPIAPAAAQLYIYLRTAAPDARVAPFIFTSATAGTKNSRIPREF